MNADFKDILSRIDEEPKWWDEGGVPRYCEFHPSNISYIYAQQVVLQEVACQGCGKRYIVCASTGYDTFTNYMHDDNNVFSPFHYGDPPNNCDEDCLAGATMNVDFIRIIQFWVRDKTTEYDWKRFHKYES